MNVFTVLIMAIETKAADSDCKLADEQNISVEFDMRINSLALNYASHPICRGDLSNGSKWVWCFYVGGKNSDGDNGKLYVTGNTKLKPSRFSWTWNF